MYRCVVLFVALLSLTAFFSFQSSDRTHSQTKRSSSPAVNALAVGSVDESTFEFCANRSIEQMDKAIAQEPKNSRLYTERATCRSVFAANSSLDEFRRSIARIKTQSNADIARALEIDENNAQAYFLRAKAAAESLEFTEGEAAKPVILQIVKDLDRSIEHRPGRADAYYYRAIFKFYDLHDENGGIKDLDTAIGLEPENVRFLTKRGSFSSK